MVACIENSTKANMYYKFDIKNQIVKAEKLRGKWYKLSEEFFFFYRIFYARLYRTIEYVCIFKFRDGTLHFNK